MFFLAHVYFAFQSFRSNKDQLTGLLRKGVVDSLFRKASKAFYLLLIPAVFITGLAAWSFYKVLACFGASGFILNILTAVFALYSIAVLASFLFGKLIQLAAHKAGL
ncbi:hypothetical protein BEN74_01525 [Acinetobacter sp. WCHAc010034]|nr:hypothetical protein BEN74_01525 [Acinetobacter sp. WCHAc010034]